MKHVGFVVSVAAVALCAVTAGAEAPEGFNDLLEGGNLDAWIGDKSGYELKDGVLIATPEAGHLFTKEEYGSFEFQFEFKLEEGGNNGIGVWTQPDDENPSFDGLEIQILDNEAEKHANIKPYQAHGSVYGIIPAKRGFQNPIGEWNEQAIIVDGRNIKVILNSETIVDGNLDEALKDGAMDEREHPGADRDSGHIALLSHREPVQFRNLYVKRIE